MAQVPLSRANRPSDEHGDAVSSHAGPGAAVSGLRVTLRLVLQLEGVCVSPFARRSRGHILWAAGQHCRGSILLMDLSVDAKITHR